MTTQEKIDVLEKAIPLINTATIQSNKKLAICCAIAHTALPPYDNICGAQQILESLGIVLPVERYGPYCWPETSEGDEQRREFLRSHIERLKKEL